MRLITSFIALCFFPLSTLFAQEQLLNKMMDKRMEDFDFNDFQKYKNYGVISKEDQDQIGIFFIQFFRDRPNPEQEKLSTFLGAYDNFQTRIKKDYNEFGSDSLFFYTPNGDAYLIGTGDKSVEKLVEEHSENLPKNYDKPYLNESFRNSKQIVKAIQNEQLNMIQAVLVVNIALIKQMDGDKIKDYKAGDFITIANRIYRSPEFAPFARKAETD